MYIDYITKLGNYDVNYLATVGNLEGYYDQYNYSTQELDTNKYTQEIRNDRKSYCLSTNAAAGYSTYVLVLSLNIGFLNSQMPLLPNTELKITFDRAKSEMAILNGSDTQLIDWSGKTIKMENVVMSAEFVSSPFLRNYFQKIERGPITYRYDDCQVYFKNLPTVKTDIRLDNIFGGNTPEHIFIGKFR